MKNTRKHYAFESANRGTVEIDVTGEYRGSYCKDFSVSYAGNEESEEMWMTPDYEIITYNGDGNGADFEEIDDADVILEWLDDQGVEFVSEKTRAFSRAYIQMVMIDRDADLNYLLDKFAKED